MTMGMPVGDAAAVAEAMRTFARDPECIGTMGRAGRALAEQRFAVRTVNATIMQALGIDTIERAAGEGTAA